MSKLALKFISGKYQGGEFSLPLNGELVIGRSADVDVVLVEDMVSRRHARLVGTNGQYTIADLDSTNGTFVNGEKIKQASLKVDDRVLVGTSILKVVLAQGGSPTLAQSRDDLQAMMKDLGQRTQNLGSSMDGDLAEVPLPDLLQLFATNKKTGVLNLGQGPKGRLFIKDGVLLHAVMAAEPQMLPMKTVCRMVGWSSGAFNFDAVAPPSDTPNTFSTTTENVLIEALRQNDEAQRILKQFANLDQAVKLSVPLRAPLAELNKSELETLQGAINHGRLRAVVDRAQVSDSEALTNLHRLVKQGYLTGA